MKINRATERDDPMEWQRILSLPGMEKRIAALKARVHLALNSQ